MMGFSTITHAKLMFLGLLSLTFLFSVGSIYIGPRYSKRQSSFDSTSQVVLRSASPKTIPTRLQTRFYPGSRYGGKRNYWETSMPETPLYTDFVLRNRQQQQAEPVNMCPFDGLYFPSVGVVRCLPGHSENPSLWSAVAARDGNEESDGSVNASPSLSGSYAS